MAENVLKLKKRAVSLGMDKADAKRADRPTLEAFIADAESGSKKVTKKHQTVAKKKAGRKSVKRGAPKKATPKAGKATKAPKVKKAAPARASSNGSGRLSIGTIDFTAESEDWNPRKGSGTQRLFAALKSTKGNVDKALAKLEGDVFDFVGKKMRDGSKRSKASALDMLRYRLNRTKFDFAKATGQHQSASAKDRAAYGTGQYATVRKAKAPKKAAAPKKASKPKATAKKRKTTKR